MLMLLLLGQDRESSDDRVDSLLWKRRRRMLQLLVAIVADTKVKVQLETIKSLQQKKGFTPTKTSPIAMMILMVVLMVMMK